MLIEKLRFHHLGIAVENLAESQLVFTDLLNLCFSPAEIVAAQGVKVTFAQCGKGKIELIQATQDRSPLFPMMEHPILSFIKKNGEGVHHVCFEVLSMDPFLQHLNARGIRPLTREPQEGTGGCRVIFLNPRDCNGVLVELKEQDNHAK